MNEQEYARIIGQNLKRLLYESCCVQLVLDKKRPPPVTGRGFLLYVYMRKGTGPVPVPILLMYLGGIQPRLSVHGSRM